MLAPLRRFQGFAMPLLFLALAFLYYMSSSVDFEEHDRFNAALRTLRQEDALLNRNLLRARYNLDRTYDPLNETLLKIDENLAILQNSDLLQRAGDLEQAFGRYQAMHVERRKLLDRFKADNAVLRNSLYYLPISVRRMLSRTGEASVLNALLRDVLIYNVSGDAEMIPRVNAYLKRIRGLGGGTDNRVLVRHVRNILSKKRAVDDEIQAIETLKANSLESRMFQAYGRWYGREVYSANIYRLLMFATATGLLLYVLFTILKLYLARSSLAEANESLRGLNAAAQKFVPVRFLDFLGRRDLREVRLGDCRLSRLTVLFSDIRAFTNLSEGMTPEENFSFINSYLSRMGPVIREHHGFIDKYIGDAIMALFDGPPANAVSASIRMLKELEGYNREHRSSAGRQPVSIGIGLHVGEMMLGTIGEADRMEGTVISDAVNLASRIETLTKQYGVQLLVSGAVLDGLGEAHSFRVRFIDEVTVKGKAIPVRVFEIFDADPPDVLEAKLASAPLLEQAGGRLRAGEYDQAAESLEKVLALLPEDGPAHALLERCRQQR